MEKELKKTKKLKRERKTPVTTTAGQLLTFNRTITLSLGDEVLKKYAGECGYTPKRLREAKKLWEKAEMAYHNQLSKQAEQVTATSAYYRLKEKAHATYLHIIQTCRLAFAKEPAVQFQLELKGKRKHDQGGWTMQVALKPDPQLKEKLGFIVPMTLE